MGQPARTAVVAGSARAAGAAGVTAAGAAGLSGGTGVAGAGTVVGAAVAAAAGEAGAGALPKPVQPHDAPRLLLDLLAGRLGWSRMALCWAPPETLQVGAHVLLIHTTFAQSVTNPSQTQPPPLWMSMPGLDHILYSIK